MQVFDAYFGPTSYVLVGINNICTTFALIDTGIKLFNKKNFILGANISAISQHVCGDLNLKIQPLNATSNFGAVHGCDQESPLKIVGEVTVSLQIGQLFDNFVKLAVIVTENIPCAVILGTNFMKCINLTKKAPILIDYSSMNIYCANYMVYIFLYYSFKF